MLMLERLGEEELKVGFTPPVEELNEDLKERNTFIGVKKINT